MSEHVWAASCGVVGAAEPRPDSCVSDCGTARSSAVAVGSGREWRGGQRRAVRSSRSNESSLHAICYICYV